MQRLCVIHDRLKKAYDFLKSLLFSDAKPIFTGSFDPALVTPVIECPLQAFDDVRVAVLTHSLIREDIVIYANIKAVFFLLDGEIFVYAEVDFTVYGHALIIVNTYGDTLALIVLMP
jgi:hypothetical protein